MLTCVCIGLRRLSLPAVVELAVRDRKFQLLALLSLVGLGLAGTAGAERLQSSAANVAADPLPSTQLAASNDFAPAVVVPPDVPAPASTDFSAATRGMLVSDTHRAHPASLDNQPYELPFTLAGTIISPAVRRALLARVKSERLEPAAEGEEIEGWTLEKILADRVILHRNTVRVELELRAHVPAELSPTVPTAVTNAAASPPPAAEEPVTGVAAYFAAHGIHTDDAQQ